MINPATDCTIPGPSDWQRMNRRQLETFATKGSPEQKASLTDWGYSVLPASFFAALYFLSYSE